jgi:hypothetical protein
LLRIFILTHPHMDLSKIVLGARPLQPRAQHYTLTLVIGNQEPDIFRKFFPACPRERLPLRS